MADTSAAKRWELTWVLGNQVGPLLDNGWEPFGVVLNPITADPIIYLRRLRDVDAE